MNQPVSNPNDFKVVDFTNKAPFDFTPEMGCMFDSRPIFGISGAKGIKAGESIKLPYHIGHRLAINLAKAMMTRQAPTKDVEGVPTGVPLWSDTRLNELKNSFIAELYTEEGPIAETEVDRLMKKVEQLNKLFTESLAGKPSIAPPPQDNDPVALGAEQFPAADEKVYQDKAEVIAELDKKKIQYDPRQSKAELEKLLA